MKHVTDCLPYPTPYMQGLFPSLCSELNHLRELVEQSSGLLPVTDGPNHEQMLDNARALIDANDAALPFFLAHPTHRLLSPLLKAAEDAAEVVIWLMENGPRLPVPTSLAQDYAACCERLRLGVADWRLSIILARADHELDEKLPETVH